MSRIVVLTGERGAGKSTVCRRTAALAGQRGYRCAGVVTLSLDGARDVLDVASGRRRRLTQTSREGPTVTQGRFRFDPQTLKWGREILSRATPCDLLVVDEIGPLEVERGRGWAIGLDIARDGDYALALLVVRPELALAVYRKLASCPLALVRVTEENRDQLPVKLVKTIGRKA